MNFQINGLYFAYLISWKLEIGQTNQDGGSNIFIFGVEIQYLFCMKA